MKRQRREDGSEVAQVCVKDKTANAWTFFYDTVAARSARRGYNREGPQLFETVGDRVLRSLEQGEPQSGREQRRLGGKSTYKTTTQLVC